MSQIDIEVEKSAARLKLDNLLMGRGAAALDGKPIDNAEIQQLEDTLAGLDDAAAELVRRERQAEKERQAASRKRLATALFEAEKTRLEAVADAEHHARRLVVSLNDIMEATSTMRGLCRRGDFEQPGLLAEPATEVRIGQYLSAVFTRMPGHGQRFGQIHWHSTHRKAADDWAALEKAGIEFELKRITEKALKNGNSSSKKN